MLAKLRSTLKGKGKEPEWPTFPDMVPSNRYDPYALDDPSSSSVASSSSSRAISYADSFARAVAHSPEKDAHFALQLQLAEEASAREQLEEDERLVYEMLEREKVEEKERMEMEERMLRELVESERVAEEEMKKREEEEFRKLVEEEEEEKLKRENGILECEVCYAENFKGEVMVQCPEGHVLCSDCAKSGAQVAFSMLDARLPCLVDGNCGSSYTPEESHKFLDDKQWKQFEKLRLEQDVAVVKGLVQCPWCPYGLIIDEEELGNLDIFDCLNPECMKQTCLKCKKPAHGTMTCVEANPTDTQRLEEAMSRELIRRCPKCDKPFIKQSGCNKITCTNTSCGAKSCYLCRAEITDYKHFDHAGPCKGKLYDDSGVNQAVEKIRLEAAKKLLTAEERKHAEKLKIK